MTPVAPFGCDEISGVLIGFLEETRMRAVPLRGFANCGVRVSYRGGVRGGDCPPHSLSLLEQEGGVGGM